MTLNSYFSIHFVPLTYTYGMHKSLKNIHPFLLQEKDGKQFYLTFDRIIYSYIYGIIYGFYPFNLIPLSYDIIKYIRNYEYDNI